MVVDQRHVAIVLVFLRRVVLGVGEFRNFGLVCVGENHRWSCDDIELSLLELVHSLQFYGVPSEIWCVERARG